MPLPIACSRATGRESRGSGISRPRARAEGAHQVCQHLEFPQKAEGWSSVTPLHGVCREPRARTETGPAEHVVDGGARSLRAPARVPRRRDALQRQ